jgi:NAD-dependent deacetylase sirtuin 4
MVSGGVRKACSLSRRHLSTAVKISGSGLTEISPLVPALISPSRAEVDQLNDFLESAGRTVVLTGAGISTPSGIPDYRGPNGSYKLGHKPMNHGEFMNNEASRKRFWARSMVGWQTVSGASPNEAHHALVRLENAAKVNSIITQNVDRLHHKAGSNNIIDLHGRVDQVRCQCCKRTVARTDWQTKLEAANQHFLEVLSSTRTRMLSLMSAAKSVRADGDAELGLDDYSKVLL